MKKIFLYLILSSSFSSKATSAINLATREAIINQASTNSLMATANVALNTIIPEKQFSWLGRFFNKLKGSDPTMKNQQIEIDALNAQNIKNKTQIEQQEFRIGNLEAEIGNFKIENQKKEELLLSILSGAIITLRALYYIARPTYSLIKQNLKNLENKNENLAIENMELRLQNQRSLVLANFLQDTINDSQNNYNY